MSLSKNHGLIVFPKIGVADCALSDRYSLSSYTDDELIGMILE